MPSIRVLLGSISLCALTSAQCPDYAAYAASKHAPFTPGLHLSFQRPIPACRTLNLPEVEDTITRLKARITDPDLSRLFENAYPNTLDTTIKWRGTAATDSAEELAFIVTGDIDAMWLRDSANQLQTYAHLLNGTDGTLASLFRGAINLQARYIVSNPYCNAFQPPLESGLQPNTHGNGATDEVTPGYDVRFVFECKYELDSLAAFLQLSVDYFERMRDVEFFGRFKWLRAVQVILDVAQQMRVSTYAADGKVNEIPYTWRRKTDRASETQANDGVGIPVGDLAGMVRSAFRPSDDATIYQGFIPANMMFSQYLLRGAQIAKQLPSGEATAARMEKMASEIRAAIRSKGVVKHAEHGKVFAYEIDGFGSYNIMDDANIPSLLAAPLSGFVDRNDAVYQNTRALVLSQSNPYWMRGGVLSGVGSPHTGPGKAWAMSLIVRIMTSENDTEIEETLRQIVHSTDGLGLIHESIATFNASDYTRPWFAWANGLFGQMVVDLDQRKQHILAKSFQ